LPAGATQASAQTKTGSKLLPSIRITSPALNDQWVIKEQHVIQWDNEALGTGAIYLVDAKTGATVGTISPSLTLHQKSFTWNGTDVLLSRGSSEKKSVEPGDYYFRIVFEVGNKQTVNGNVFSLIYPSQKPLSSGTFIIKNYTALPNQITIKKGDPIYFVNNDQVTHVIKLSGFPGITVPSGATVKFEVSLNVGSYEFYSSDYSGLKMGVTVQ
jgi:hypothetical protein